MSNGTKILVIIIVIVVSVRAMSYGIWNWRSNNKLGAVAVFLISLLTIALPIYMTFFKE